jgi:hypothetical protein
MNKRKHYRFFICYVHDTGGDFARHLKQSFKKRDISAFLDDDDIPKDCVKQSEWRKHRDNALRDSKSVLFIVTEGFEKSPEVIKEVSWTLEKGKSFKIFRHIDLSPEIVFDSGNEQKNLGRYYQTSFETKEELTREVLSPKVKDI